MRIALLLALVSLAGCASKPVRVTYIPVPAGYLELCELPAVPEDNTGLSDAFVQAYKCAEIGNRDKQRTAKWQEQIDSRLR